jgi:hypothetical protein
MPNRGRSSRSGTLHGGQFDWGGRLPKCNGGARWWAQAGRTSAAECNGTSPPDCETGGPAWKGHRSTDKRYSRDNRLISPKSPHRRGGLAPRCRLITSRGWSRSQGFGCSPIKVVRELGLERRETVRSLSAVGVGDLRGSVPSTRGPGWTHLWCTGCRASGSAG